MGKGIVCVCIYSIAILITFCVMMYLMITLNPPNLEPLKAEIKKKLYDLESKPSLNTQLVTNNPQGGRRKLDNISIDYTDASSVDPPQYGLNMADAVYLDFYPLTILRKPNKNNLTGVFKFAPRHIIPPLWPRTPQRILIDPALHKVMLPIWPSITASKSDLTFNGSYIAAISRNISNFTDSKSNFEDLSEKPMKRRSIGVNNNKHDDDYGLILLNILDRNRQPIIEIKLAPKLNSLDQNENSEEDDIIVNNKSKFNGHLFENNQHKDPEYIKDTIVTILPNDSVFIDEIKGNIDVSNNTNLDSIISMLQKNQNVSDYIDNSQEGKPLLNETGMAGDMSLKVLIENEPTVMENTTQSKVIDDMDHIFDSKIDKIENIFHKEGTYDVLTMNETQTRNFTNLNNKQTNNNTDNFIENKSDTYRY